MELSLINLLLVLLAGWLAGSVASRVGYPPVLGELLVGILLGPPLLGILHGGEALAVLAEIGILLMMLYVGMEVDPRELGKASWPGLLAAAGGFITPFTLAYFAVIWFGGTPMGAIFVAIAAGVTSLTTKSRILVDLRLLDTRVAHVMMAGALVSDTLSLIVFAGVLGVLEVGTLELATVGVVALKVVLFFALTFLVGLKVFPFVGRRLTEAGLTNRTFNFTLVLILAVSFGELAHLAGLHAILGAFIAGLFIRDNVLGRTLSEDLKGAVRDSSIGFLAPIFFVTAGFQVSFSVFSTDLALFMTILGVATFGKIIGTAIFYIPSGNGWREGLTVGGGMNGRGAVEIIVAGIALESGLISQEIFSILVFMAIFTTATVPFFLKWGTEWLKRRGELVRSGDDRRGTLILGAGPTARVLARTLSPSRPVWMVDANEGRCRIASGEGLQVTCGNALQEQVLSDAHASEADSLVALTGNTEVNALAAQMARSVFMVPAIQVVQDGAHHSGHASSLSHLQASTLFGGPIGLSEWDHWVGSGLVKERSVVISPDLTDSDLAEEIETRRGRLLPLAVRKGDEIEPFHSAVQLANGDEVTLLEFAPTASRRRDRFDELVAGCTIFDIRERLDLETFLAKVAEELGEQMSLRGASVTDLFGSEGFANTVMSPGLAIPHILIGGTGKFEMLIARCREGLNFPDQEEPVTAVFVLVRTADERTFHLRALSAIAQIVQAPTFTANWLGARDAEELRSLLLAADRRRF
ncbi:MAG TPA: cation:proton antiporter [Longimicrobiaceae bacterium]|nr:cation:proton antiporter [Longimicrobiaceae bacterium]